MLYVIRPASHLTAGLNGTIIFIVIISKLIAVRRRDRMNYEVEYLKNYLGKYEINASNIRLQLLDRLLSMDDHPTAYKLYEELIEQIPTLSKTSIYNTLEIFTEKGLVKPIILNEAETRFDIHTKDHGHFKCKKCGNIYDFQIKNTVYDDLDDFQILQEDIQLYGICHTCR